MAVGQAIVAADLAPTILAKFPLQSVAGVPVAGNPLNGGEGFTAIAFIALGLNGPGNGNQVVGANTFSRVTDPDTAGTVYAAPLSGTRCRIPTKWQQTSFQAAVVQADAIAAAKAQVTGFAEVYGASYVIYTLSAGPGPEQWGAIAMAAGR